MKKSYLQIGAVIMALVTYVAYLLYDNIMNAQMYMHLPGGYTLTSMDDGDILKYDGNENPLIQTVGPSIDGYKVYRSVLIGHITANPKLQFEYVDAFTYQNSGYFTIDLKTRKFSGGLTKQNWLSKLKSYGITTEPELYKPSWHDERLGRTKPQDIR